MDPQKSAVSGIFMVRHITRGVETANKRNFIALTISISVELDADDITYLAKNINTPLGDCDDRGL